MLRSSKLSLPLPVQRMLRTLRRAVLLRRRWLAAVCAGVAVAAGLQAVSPEPPETVLVSAAARDLPSGALLQADDLVELALPPAAVPAGLVQRAVGRVLAAPMRRGEVLTDARLMAPGLLAGYPGLLAVPVRLPDPGVRELLRVGDLIDLVAVDPAGGGTRVVARRAVVLALPDPTVETSASGLAGALVVIGTTPDTAGQVAEAAVRSYLSVQFGA